MPSERMRHPLDVKDTHKSRIETRAMAQPVEAGDEWNGFSDEEDGGVMLPSNPDTKANQLTAPVSKRKAELQDELDDLSEEEAKYGSKRRKVGCCDRISRVALTSYQKSVAKAAIRDSDPSKKTDDRATRYLHLLEARWGPAWILDFDRAIRPRNPSGDYKDVSWFSNNLLRTLAVLAYYMSSVHANQLLVKQVNRRLQTRGGGSATTAFIPGDIKTVLLKHATNRADEAIGKSWDELTDAALAP